MNKHEGHNPRVDAEPDETEVAKHLSALRAEYEQASMELKSLAAALDQQRARYGNINTTTPEGSPFKEGFRAGLRYKRAEERRDDCEDAEAIQAHATTSRKALYKLEQFLADEHWGRDVTELRSNLQFIMDMLRQYVERDETMVRLATERAMIDIDTKDLGSA